MPRLRQRFRTLKVAAVLTGSCLSGTQAAITWDWSFGSNAGQLTTTGDFTGGPVHPGSFEITDFRVLSSGEGATLGSVLSGAYTLGVSFSTSPPFTLVWDGNEVSQWLHSGTNTFDWVVFDEVGADRQFFFGWETGNINTVLHASYTEGAESSPLTVTPVPEPSAAWLMVLAGLAGARRDRRPDGHRQQSSPPASLVNRALT